MQNIVLFPFASSVGRRVFLCFHPAGIVGQREMPVLIIPLFLT